MPIAQGCSFKTLQMKNREMDRLLLHYNPQALEVRICITRNFMMEIQKVEVHKDSDFRIKRRYIPKEE